VSFPFKRFSAAFISSFFDKDAADINKADAEY
jgi:hypothetical protein